MQTITTMLKRMIYLLTALLWGSCSENNVYVDCGTNPPNDGGDGTGGTTLVTFHASVEGRNITRALSPVRKNVQAELYAFDGAAADASGVPVGQGSYLSMTPGLLTGINGYRMHLPNGTYNFYGVSDNSQFPAPAFVEGLSEPLYNGIDYLWWAGLQQDVTSSQTGIPIVFLHCATQVSFELVAGEDVVLNQLALAHLYASTDGAQMRLSSGVIPSVASYQTTVSKMGINGFLAQYIMLPVKTDLPLSVSFDVRINSEITARTFAVDVPLPDGELKAGNSYRFKAVIRGNEITFPSVSVRSWVDVDETGNPLYPTEE
ncbi:MAG: fimbrillin family protein [Alistipes sp.]